MRRLLASASTTILLSTSAWIACSNSSSNPPASPGTEDAATIPTGTLDSSTPTATPDTGTSSPETGATAEAAPPTTTPVVEASTPTCTAGSGATVQAKWDFAVSMASLNGGKGQLLTAHVCDTVVWTNDDNGISHSVVSTGGGFTFSTPIVAGTTAGVALAPVQFTSKGTFTYDCGVHGMMMIGQITID